MNYVSESLPESENEIQSSKIIMPGLSLITEILVRELVVVFSPIQSARCSDHCL